APSPKFLIIKREDVKHLRIPPLHLATVAAIIVMDYYHKEDTSYYGNGSKAKYVRFLLETAQPDLFCKITGLEQPTFDTVERQTVSVGK
ncbi:hypothetical protein VP01_326g10, partial [Puccinia sorghi]